MCIFKYVLILNHIDYIAYSMFLNLNYFIRKLEGKLTILNPKFFKKEINARDNIRGNQNWFFGKINATF